MPGSAGVPGAQPVEYLEETNFATEVDEGDYLWFGLVNSWNVTQGVEAETVRYLPDDSSSNKLETLQNVKVSEAFEAELTYNPQDLTLLQYFTGAVGSTSDDLNSLQVGEQDETNGEYRRLLGCVGEEFTLEISEDSVAEATASFISADATNWSATDYTADVDSDGTSGTHATEDTSEPFTYGDLGNLQLGGTDLPDAVETLTLTISNDLEIVKDPNAARDSNIAALVPTSREISVELALTYDDMSMAQTVRNYTPQDLNFDLDTTTFTVSNVAFPEFPYEMSPTDLIGDTVTSDPAEGLSWA